MQERAPLEFQVFCAGVRPPSVFRRYDSIVMHARIRELQTYLDEQRAVLRAAYDAVPEPLRDAPPAPGRWSPSNVVEHLAIVEGRVAAALRKRIDEARANLLGPDPSSDPILPSLPLARVVDRETRVNAPDVAHPTGLRGGDAWAALERASATLRETLTAGDGLDLTRVMHPHPIFGELDAYAWFGFIGAHEARHAGQIREDYVIAPR